jgi:GDSL-like Lipase/Acylhydrolase family
MSRKVVLAVVLALAALAATGGTAHAKGFAVVSMGDSFISGESGRWQGNAGLAPTEPYFGTDRACDNAGCDPANVYGATAGGCDRSDVAEILSASIRHAERFNVSCSGARTNNLLRSGSGGVGQHGEPPQGDQLAEIASKHSVRLIVVSIGGNNIGFSTIVAQCLLRYVGQSGTCYQQQQPLLEAALPGMRDRVAEVVDDIRATMEDAGYSSDDYRLILQSYSSPITDAAHTRYPQGDGSMSDGRVHPGGCPFYDADLDWAKGSAVNQIDDSVLQVAAEKGTEFLDLRAALDGREVCATASSQVDKNGPSPNASEWARFVSVTGQGTLSEWLHPNAYAQQAYGTCLGLLWREAPGSYGCDNTPGGDTTEMVLSPQ